MVPKWAKFSIEHPTKGHTVQWIKQIQQLAQ